ncbi:MAG: hypothetical protein ACC645_05060 [Pirellulales bacterium]
MLWVVPGGVLAMFTEFDRESVKRAGVETLQIPLDDEPRAEIEPRNLADDFRFQVLFGRNDL